MVEDTHTSYQPEFGNPNKKSFINFSKKIIDDINYTYPGLGEFEHSLNKYIYSMRYFESFVVCYIDKKKTYINTMIENKSMNFESVEDTRYENSIVGELIINNRFYNKFKFLKKYKLATFLVRKIKKILIFLDSKRDLNKYKKYFK